MSRRLWTRLLCPLVLLPLACQAPDPGTAGAEPSALEAALQGSWPTKCTTDAQCNDHNTCTADRCVAHKCVFSARPNGTACDDGNLCTLGDTCRTGVCRAGTQATCTALDACHKPGVCNPKTGVCTNPVGKDGVACQDGNACTVGDRCKKGVCKAGAPLVCDDADVCTNDSCDPAKGCVFATYCDDDDPCTADGCDAGICQYTTQPAGTACDDGDPCSLDDACAGYFAPGERLCWGGRPQDCDDADPCTWDGCDSVAGCIHGPACDDGNPCTVDLCDPTLGECVQDWLPDGAPCESPWACGEGATCLGGWCQPMPGACDDGNPCTTDGCNPDGQCGHWENTCNDGNACTTDSCDPATGACTSVARPDGDSCTGPYAEMCVTGTCVHARCRYDYNMWSQCDDGDACTVDHCGATGTCVHDANTCDDGNPCTIDTCDPSTGCVATPVADGTDCGGGDLCLESAVCQGGACAATTRCDDGDACTLDACRVTGSTYACYHGALWCDDGNPCTVDRCDPTAGGCVNEPQDEAPCDDGNLCTLGDVCLSGWCQGQPLDCDDGDPNTVDTCDWWYGGCYSYNPCNDGNPCTVDQYDPAWGCSYGPAAEGVACEDGNVCTTGDTCLAGMCGVPTNCDDGDPLTVDECWSYEGCVHYNPCDDGNPCTVDQYDPAWGCSYGPAADGVPCEDWNACTEGDTCVSGGCGVPVNCDDGDPATVDGCDGWAGCYHFAPCEDGNPCTVDTWDPMTGCIWSSVEDGAPCDDGRPCTEGDTCVGGACGVLQGCDDGDPCTSDWCDDSSGCQHYVGCDDWNECTDNACDPATGACIFTPVADGAPCGYGQVYGCREGAACQNGLCMEMQVDCGDGNLCSRDQCWGEFVEGGYICVHLLDTCNDDNSCTADSCDPATGCQHALLADGTTCDDGNVCTTGDVCQAGLCQATPVDCDDGDPCTQDWCEPSPVPGPLPGPPSVGCVHYNPCDDGNPCTIDGCDADGLCLYQPLEDGAPCVDDWSCTSAESCQGGKCAGLQACDDGDPCTQDDCYSWYWGEDSPYECNVFPLDCNDGNSCTTETCEPGVGCAYVPLPEGSACDDGSTCTTDDTCAGGLCVGTPSPGPCIDCGGPCEPGTTYEGCCDAGRVVWCENGVTQCLDCQGAGLACGWKAESGFYDCGGDGADPSGQFPIECPAACAPVCEGKACGDDGCGGSCGECPPGQACVDFQCGPCSADCTGVECGPDGCAGSCGTCAEGSWCGADQLCHAAECTTAADCAEGAACINGTCVAQGGGTCPSFYACANACPNQDSVCIQGCLEQLSPEARALFEALNGCLSMYCASATTQEEFDQCLRQNCQRPFEACFGYPY